MVAVLLIGVPVFNQSPEDLPTRVTGEFDFKSAIVPKYFSQGATAALICISDSLTGTSANWVPKSEQIIGRFTTPVWTAPIKFEIDLPFVPTCRSVDVDNNGQPDNGVKLFAAINAIHLYGDSYLEQLEQESGFLSILSDAKNGTIRSGTVLVYAPDNNQKVPISFGPDKRLFTADDETVGVPAGYSLMKIAADGKITFDNSTTPRMDILQPEEGKNPDFSGQGILESFNSLIDLLKERYAYTELRKIDWEKKRADYLPRVKAADAANDLGEYYIILYEFASRMRDGHVQSATYDPKIAPKRFEMLKRRLAGNLGAELIRYTDGRFVIYAVGKDTPAARAGLVPGTEVIKINGLSVRDHLDTLPARGFVGTEERGVAVALAVAFAFPIGEKVDLEFKRPGDTVAARATLTAVEIADFSGFPPLRSTEDPFEMRSVGDGKFGYVRWNDFENVPYTIAGFETFLSRWNSGPGIIIDLRGNSGGLIALFYTLASYMFPPDSPVSKNWLDSYVYDDALKTFVKLPNEGQKMISSPRPELAFKGKVVVLVDGSSASAAEFFSQFLQKKGRATVIADSGTDGAGGSVRLAIMPGKIPFTYTGGQMFYAGTREPNLEGKGVTPDLRIPINDEYVRRRLNGEDVVLTEAIKYLEANTKPAAESQ